MEDTTTVPPQRSIKVSLDIISGTPVITYARGDGDTSGDVVARGDEELLWECDQGDLVLLIKGKLTDPREPSSRKERKTPFDRFTYCTGKGDKNDKRKVKSAAEVGAYEYRVMVVTDDGTCVVSPDPRIIIN